MQVVKVKIAILGEYLVIGPITGGVRFPRRPPHTSESCLSQPAWTITPKRREQNLIVRSSKSEAEESDDKRLRSKYCTSEANY